MAKCVVSIDQGTTSTRCVVFNHQGKIIAIDQKEHRQIYPHPGWLEHDPLEIWQNTTAATHNAVQKARIEPADIAAIGITNQRETTVVWDRKTGLPLGNAIVWQDTRTDALCRQLASTGGKDRFRKKTGLPLATYFSGPKLAWMLQNMPGLRKKAESGDALFGTIDSWLIWNLTGGARGGIHATDVTNASRTLLMDIHTLTWDDAILSELGIPASVLPEIKPSVHIYGCAASIIEGAPVAACLGDQQAALFGQTCFNPGEAKNTYGTGCFLLLNTGTQPVASHNGLLTTLGYQIGNQLAIYCLEGSIAITGALVQWLRDNLKMINSANDIEPLAKTVTDNGGIYIVPAFSGLFAPYWRSDARGVIVGITRYIHRGHFARAVLEATAYQTREVMDAMETDAGMQLSTLKVDGGMVVNELLMQFQADILGIPVVRPKVSETTALGAAYAAGLAVGFWQNPDELRGKWEVDKAWQPAMPESQRNRLYRGWKKAVIRTFDWVE